MQYDYLIVGGGIIGLSTAWQLKQRYPDASILLLEKEPELAAHQTGHNSGVIHSGIYYQPGSLKAELCRRGLEATIQFCQQRHIKYEQCGKLLVATNKLENARMQDLYQRSLDNKVDCQLLSMEALKDLEPAIYGLGAIHVKATGIVDYREICRHMANEFISGGGRIEFANPVFDIEESDKQISVTTGNGRREAGMLICCAGLQADRIVKLHGLKTDFRFVPFRGEYYRVSRHYSDRISRLIYPIPDPAMPFLGIHLTRMIDGTMTVGPNAVLGLKREGYGRFNFSLKDSIDILSYPGFWRLVAQYLKPGIVELKNAWFKSAYLRQVRRYLPGISLSDLSPYPAGIRAQAVLSNGTLEHDFLFKETERSLHVCNAPSPAATSAIPIGEYICDHVYRKL